MSNKIGTQIKLNDISYLQFIREYDQKKEERLKRIFQSGKIFTIEEITRTLKTMYPNTPLSLIVSYNNHINSFIIRYQNKEFNYTHRKILAEKEKIEVTYNEKGLNFSSTKKHQKEEELSLFIKEEIKRINHLKNMQGRALNSVTEKEANLWKTYQAFYQENPDFSKEETKEKAKDMSTILRHYHLISPRNTLEEEKKFEILAPFGEIKEENNLEEQAKRQLKILGEISKNIDEYLKGATNTTRKETNEKKMILVKSK